MGRSDDSSLRLLAVRNTRLLVSFLAMWAGGPLGIVERNINLLHMFFFLPGSGKECVQLLLLAGAFNVQRPVSRERSFRLSAVLEACGATTALAQCAANGLGAA